MNDIKKSLESFSKQNFTRIDKSFEHLTVMLEKDVYNQLYSSAHTIKELFVETWKEFDEVRQNPTHDSLYAISTGRFVGISNLLALLRDHVDVLRSKEIREYVEKLSEYVWETGRALDEIAEELGQMEDF